MINQNNQISTFYIADRLYGIDVMKVQEITNSLPMARIPLAPHYVRGLINLRGQISTAISLRDLFGITSQHLGNNMNVVCKLKEILASFLVDQIGDVLELSDSDFEAVPETVPNDVRRFLSGVYKIQGSILSVIDVDKISYFFMNSINENIQKEL